MSLLIKRYDNRKLYDTEGKRYISIEEVGDLVRHGREIHVIDNSTGADLTAETLTKILMEGGRKGTRLPAAFLHDLVRWGDKVRSTTFDQFEQRIEQFVKASMDRLGPVRQIREEMEALRERIEDLERMIADLTAGPEVDHEKTSPGVEGSLPAQHPETEEHETQQVGGE